MTVLFIHGIDQQEFTAAQLLTTWTNNIEDVAPGLLLNTPVQMAYYATILAEFSAGSFSSATTMGSDLSNANSAELNFCYDVLDEIAIANGLDLSTVQQVMSGETDDIVPMGSSLLRSIVRIAAALEKKAPQRTEIVLRLLKQAYIYLTVMSARRAVDSAVRPMIEQNPQILITHSLGTVVAFNILQQLEKEMASIDIPLFITLGPPWDLKHSKPGLKVLVKSLVMYNAGSISSTHQI